MAFMNQERKASLAPAIKAALKKYGIKGTLSVYHHSTLVLTIKEGSINFFKNYNETIIKFPQYNNHPLKDINYFSINPYWYHEHFSGEVLDFLKEVVSAMNVGNWNNSDIMTDYFDVGWYIDINIGRWNKPYVYKG